MATQIPFNADGLQTSSSIVAETFNFTDGEAVSLRPELRKVDGNLVATTSFVMSSDVKGVAVTSESEGNYGMWFNEITADADGNMYVVGGSDDTNRPVVFSYTPTGALRWKVGIDQVENNNTTASSIVYRDGQVTVGFRYYTSSSQVGLVTLSAADGTVTSSTVLSSPQDSNPNVTSLGFTPSGSPVIFGSSYGDFVTYENLTPQTGSASGVLILNKADLSTPVSPNGSQTWQVYTGSQWVNTSNVNALTLPVEAITGTGTGLTAYIRWEGVTDTYDYVWTQSQGSGYLNGDRIRIRGSLMGGTDNTDITATATSFSDVNGVTVAVFDKATYPTLGSANSTWLIIWTDTGLVQNIATVTDAGTSWEVTLTGGGIDFTNPVLFTGGGNDALLYINTYGGSYPYVYKLADTPAPQKVRFEVYDSTDFSTGGPYSVRLNLNSQLYVWTPDWQHTFGDSDYQYAKDVAVNQNTGDIYLYSSSSGQINGINYRSSLMKLNSSGVTQWSKFVEDSTSLMGQEGSVLVDGSGNVITVHENDDGYTVVTKLDSDGTLIWQSRQTNDSEWDNEPRGTVDSDGNIYISGAWYDNDEDCEVVSFMKLSGTDGSLVWARFFGNNERLNMYEFYDDDSQPFTIVGSSMFYCGYCYDRNDDEYVGVALRMPTDGTGIGIADRWKYWEDAGAQFEDNTDNAAIIDNGQGTPVDTFSQTVNGSISVSTTTNDVGYNDIFTKGQFGSGGGSIFSLASITWGDGTVQDTAHERHGDYSFSDSTFNIPNSATLDASGKTVTMNVSDYTTNADYYRINGVTQYEFSGSNYYVYSNSADIRGSSRVFLFSNENVAVKTGNTGGNYQDEWRFDNAQTLSLPKANNGRMTIQGTVTTIKSDVIAAQGFGGYISGQIFYTATSARVYAAKVTVSTHFESGTALTTQVAEFLVTRRYDGGPNAADRVNDTTTWVRTGMLLNPPTTNPLEEMNLTTAVDSYGRITARVSYPAGGNSGELIYTTTEFEASDGIIPPYPGI